MGFMDVLGKVGGIVGGPLGGLAGGILGNIFGKDPQQAESDAYNQWLGERGAAKEDLLGRLTAAGFDPFGPQTTSQTGSTWGSGTSDSTTRGREASQIRQIVDAAQARGKQKVTDLMESRLGEGRSEAEKIAALVNINNQTRAAQTAAANKAGIRGLGAMQSYGAMAGPEQQAAAARIAYLDPANDLARNRQAEADFMGLMEQWKGQNQNRQYQSRTTGQTNQFGGSTGQTVGGPDTNFLANMFLPEAPQATGGGLTQNKLTDIFGGASQALSGLYGGSPSSTAQQAAAVPGTTGYQFDAGPGFQLSNSLPRPNPFQWPQG